MNRIIQVFYDTDLRNGLDGLTAMAKTAGIDPSKIKQGEFLVFINSAKEKLRVVPAADVYLHYRSPKGKLNLSMIQFIPKYFNGTRINFDAALREALLKNGVKEVKT